MLETSCTTPANRHNENTTQRKEFEEMMFPDLKVGDVVLRYKEIEIIRGGWGAGVSKTIIVEETVARVTPKQAVTESGHRFTRNDGTPYGDSSGFRGGVYPVGYERPQGFRGKAMTMQATPPDRVQELEALASAARAFSLALAKMDRVGQSRVLHQAISHLGEQTAIKALEDARLAIEVLMEGVSQ